MNLPALGRGWWLATLLSIFSVPVSGFAQALEPRGTPARIERELGSDLASARVRALTVRAALQGGAGVDAAAVLAGDLDRIAASDLLLTDQQQRMAERLASAGASAAIADRLAQMTALIRSRLDPLRRDATAIRDAIGSGDRSQLQVAVDAVIFHLGEQTAGRVDRTPLGVTLPQRPLNLPQTAPALGPAVVPAYLRTPPPAPGPADLASSEDAPLAGEIAARAQALARNPIALFEFVQTQVATEFYYGSMKGARQTLAEKAGNDIDQASLLIALLRAAGVPARYVRGVIRLSDREAQAWTSVGSAGRVADVLTRAGIPFVPVREGGVIAAFQIEHTWVEAFVPYANYRGAPLDAAGHAWVPLDPSFKAAQVAASTPIPPGLIFTGDALVASYLAGLQSLGPIDFYRKTLSDHLALTGGVALESVLFRRTLPAATAGLLASTLPYLTVSVNGEQAELPSALRHTVRVTAEGDDARAFDVTLPVSEVLGRRLTVSYVPATVEDQIASGAFLGLDNTPAYLVKVRPVLKVAGVIRAAGEAVVQMGNPHAVTIELRTPRAVVPITNNYIAGGYYAVALAAAGTEYVAQDEPAPSDTEQPAADLLFRQAATYLSSWNDADRALSELLHVVHVTPMVSEVVVGNVYNRTMLFGQPQAIEWRGVFVDADLRVSEPVPAGAADSRATDFRRMSGLAGSMLEGDVLEQAFGVDAVSAAKLVQLARAGSIAVHTITAANAAVEIPLLQTDDLVKTDLADAVRQGWQALVPQSDLVRNAWSGIGYVLHDPRSGAGGYFISGGLAGGMTAAEADAWAQHYVDALSHPYAPPANTNPTAAFSIRRLSITDQQEGTAGAQLPRDLSVWVLDAEGVPVKGAQVTFRIVSGGGTFAGAETVTTTTDGLGIASANPILGRRTADAPFYVKQNASDLAATQVGQNLVQAAVRGTGGDIPLDGPFQLFGFPGAPSRIVKVLGDGNFGFVGTSGGTLRARLVDQHENSISNRPVAFRVLPAVPMNGTLPVDAINLKLYPQATCAVPNPLIGDCNATDNLTVPTSIFGASAESILGDTLGTTFRVSASSSGVTSETFSLHSDRARDYSQPTYEAPLLSLTILSLVNDRGMILNAAEVGTVFKRPLGAMLVMSEDRYRVEATGTLPCGAAPQAACFHVVPTQTTRVRPVDAHRNGPAITFASANDTIVAAPKSSEAGQVTFATVTGGGAAVPAVASGPANNPGGGRYLSRLTVGPQPAVNLVRITGAAEVWTPRLNPATGVVTPVLAVMQAGDEVSGFDASGVPILYRNATSLEDPVFGVRATIVAPETVLIGASGGTTIDFDLEYQIEPAEYDAQLANVDLFEVAAPADTWLGLLPGTKPAGAGVGRIHRGTGFDASRRYRAQLVLNRGSDAEVKSAKQELSAYLTGPFGVDFRSREYTAENSRRKKTVDLQVALVAERATLRRMIGEGLVAGASCGVAISGLSILEQGSGACFWRDTFAANPVATCAAFHPGVSDHDYEVLIPDGTQGDVACLVNALNTAGEAAKLGDVSFFVVSKQEFTGGLLNIDPPSGGGADITGDLGLGRQSLLLKWALEGAYVTGIAALTAAAPSLDAVLARLSATPIFPGEPTGIPRLEGFEWATLQEYSFYKSKSHVRISGAAADPKSYLYELQQKELHDAAKAGIRATMGRLVADPRGNQLLFISRQQYNSPGGCLTGTEDPSHPRPPSLLFAKTCDSFEEHIASTVVRSVREQLGIFSPADAALTYQFYRIKADAPCAAAGCRTQITSEADANMFVAATLKFIRDVSVATKDVYDQTVAGGADPRSAQRLANADAAEIKRAALALRATRTLNERVLNENAIELGVVPLNSAVPLNMYTGQLSSLPGIAPAVSYVVPRVAAGSDTIVDVIRNVGGQPVLDNEGREQPVFKVEVPAAQTSFVSFVLDPLQTIRDCNTQDNFTGFFTYPLDPANPGSVPALPPYPGLPVTFSPPPAECVLSAVPSVRVSKLVNNQPHIKVTPYTPVTITHLVTNPGMVSLEGVQVADLLTGTAHPPFALAAGQSKRLTETYVPHDVGKELTAPSEVLAFAAGGATATAWDSVAIDLVPSPCAVVITQLDRDPNPYDDQGSAISPVMEGGNAYRYYRVFGAGLNGGTVSYTVNGTTRSAAINPFGDITHMVDGQPVNGLEIAWSDLGAGGSYPVQFVSVNGSTSVCGQSFLVEVTPREFTRTFTAGASIGAEGTIGIGIAGSAGAGISIAIDERPGFTRTKLALERSLNASLGVQVGVSTSKAKIMLPGFGGQLGASAKATLSVVLSLSDSHEFAFPPNSAQLAPASSSAFGALLLSTLATANRTENPLIAKVLEAIASQSNFEPFLASQAVSVGVEQSNTLGGGGMIGLGIKKQTTNFPDLKYGLGAGASLSGKGSATFGLEAKHRTAEIVPSFGLKATFDVGGFIGVGTVAHEVTQTPDGEQDVLKLKDQIKASAKYAYGGAISAKLNLDVLDDYAPTKFSLSFSTTKDWGWQVGPSGFQNTTAGGEPERVTQTFTLSDKAAIAKVIDRLESISHLVKAFTSGAPTPGVLLTPTLLQTELDQLFVTLLTSDAQYEVSSDRGHGIALPFALELGGGARVELSAGVNFDRAISHALEKGVVKWARLYPLEKYKTDALIPGLPAFNDVADLASLVQVGFNGVVDATTAFVDVVTGAVTPGPNERRSNKTAALAFDGATAPFPSVSIASFTYEEVAGPVQWGPQRPGDIIGPDGPHFGVGGFHQFLPADAMLTAPGQLTFFYKDAEVASLNEQTLAIYSWNKAAKNWDYVGGTVDAAANTITTTVRRLGLYTVAPPLPASAITLSSRTTAAGSPDEPATAVTYTSGAIRMNSGTMVPDGTLFTVHVLQPSTSEALAFGVVTSQDADPSSDGMQVASVNGAITFSALYPGAFGSARVLVFANRGVAQGDMVLPYQ